MRKAQANESGTKKRMLEVAAALFAEHGFDVVSVRDVTQASKLNVAAVNYHFGSRDGLVARVIGEAMRHFNEERLARLEGVEKRFGSKAAPLEEVLEAWVRPLASAGQRSTFTDPVIGPLIARILVLPEGKTPQEVVQAIAVIDDRAKRLLARSLTPLAMDEIGWRMHWLVGALSHMLLVSPLPGGLDAVLTDSLLGRFVKFASAAMREGVESAPIRKNSPQATFDF